MALRKKDAGYVAPIDDNKLQWWLDQLAGVVSELRAVPLLDGHLLEDVVLKGGGETTKIAHGLGRKPKGHIIVKRNAAVTYTIDQTATTPSRELWLLASGAATVTLWVF